MKTFKSVLITILFSLFISSHSFGQIRVRSYTKSNGTLVESYYRTRSDNTKSNNYSTKGNINPYTEKRGSINPNKVDNRISSQSNYLIKK
jgi:hypothetical protein